MDLIYYVYTVPMFLLKDKSLRRNNHLTNENFSQIWICFLKILFFMELFRCVIRMIIIHCVKKKKKPSALIHKNNSVFQIILKKYIANSYWLEIIWPKSSNLCSNLTIKGKVIHLWFCNAWCALMLLLYFMRILC